ncbi:CxC ATPase DNA modification system associated small protein [Alloalcanivorax marinus]|jgi:hypothetical protein|uniref:CxC ATPase DNA modification system associated small protein n=1 Tax=Alloalcanivorax marinus TaxID=1177169 RepID=UPI00396A7701|tara:strand:- start:4158 stop:4349 length:192 start_codon:yes stop_codon:yes gene_type:complete
MPEVQINPTVKEAIRQAVERNGQPHTVSKKLIKWIEEMYVTDLPMEERRQFLEMILASIEVGG